MVNALALALLLVGGQSWRASTAPGPSSKHHESTADTCDACHMPFKGLPNEKCLTCHTGLKKFHATVASQKCTACHGEHQGPAMDQTKPAARAAFDHSATGFTLVGAHQRVPCAKCHDKPMAKMATACASCHVDTHQGTLGAACASCHTSDAWKPARHPLAEHTLSLEGGHAKLRCLAPAVECAACHEQKHGGTTAPCLGCHTVQAWKPAKFDHSFCTCTLPRKHQTVECLACHKDFDFKHSPTLCSQCHDSQRKHEALGECSLCHSATSWKKNEFDHNKKSKFKLAGLHLKVACERCHPVTAGAMRFRGVGSTCEACHQNKGDAAHGSFGGCATCHATDGWDKSSFDHASTGFPLTGRHAKVGCKDCHQEKTKGYPKEVPGKKVGVLAPSLEGPAVQPERSRGPPTTEKGLRHPSTQLRRLTERASPFSPSGVEGPYDHGIRPAQMRSSTSLGGLIGTANPFSPSGVEGRSDPATRRSSVGSSTQPVLSEVEGLGLHGAGLVVLTNPLRVNGGSAVLLASLPTSDALPLPVRSKRTWTADVRLSLKPSAPAPTPPPTHATVQACSHCHEDRHHGSTAKIGECSACHTSEAWTPATFTVERHAATRFPLTGRHAAARCSLCHSDSRFDDAPIGCASCHMDRHDGRLGTACESCHTSDAFKPVPGFDHAKTRFVLTGGHAKATCAACHEGARGAAMRASQTPAACVTCHAPRHGKELGADCASCHDPAGGPFSAARSMHFAHETTGFSLERRHATAACSACHPAQGPAPIARCASCHADVHRGHLGQGCEDCHVPDRFRVVRFDHDRTAWPLRGKHFTVPCASCHTAQRWVGLPDDCWDCHAADAARARARTPGTHPFGPLDCATCHASMWRW